MLLEVYKKKEMGLISWDDNKCQSLIGGVKCFSQQMCGFTL